MANASTDELDKVRRQAQSENAKRDVKDSVSTLRADMSELAGSVKRLADAEFGDTAAKAQEAAQRGLGEMEKRIRSNPTQSALIAAGVGFLVGLIVSR